MKECLESCKEGISNLEGKLKKLRTHEAPSGVGQHMSAKLQRSLYPFKTSTLAKLQDLVSDLQEGLTLAIKTLQLDLGIATQRSLIQLEGQMSTVALRSEAIETTVGQVHAQGQDITDRLDNLLHGRDAETYRNIIDWLSPPDPGSNHNAARGKHEPFTGSWLLQSEQYQRWKNSQVRHLWLHGKAGCGKSVLCSTVIEDVYRSHMSDPAVGCAMFYFSFSDVRKQSSHDLLLSLVAQLCWKDPGFADLRQLYERKSSGLPGADTLDKTLRRSISGYDKVFILLDALDECPEADDVRDDMLRRLKRLSGDALNLKIFATSRELSEIETSMEDLGAEMLPIDVSSVNGDINNYVASELTKDKKLSSLNKDTRLEIQNTFKEKADGMFRWAYCQLQELKRLKSFKPKYVTQALLDLPPTLDDTYARMLTSIDEKYREEATTALQWLVFSFQPLTLAELAEACIVDPAGDGSVDINNRGEPEDIPEILSGLVTIDKVYHYKKSVIRLAHFSVKEYLVSKRILASNAAPYAVGDGLAHRFIAQSCLVYLMYCNKRKEGTFAGAVEDFPLRAYASEGWHKHSKLQHPQEVQREIALLQDLKGVREMLDNLREFFRWQDLSRDDHRKGRMPALYVAARLGLETVAAKLIAGGADANMQGGRYGSALQAASIEGHQAIVELLLAKGADANMQGGTYGSALQAASYYGRQAIVELLLANGATVNMQGATYGSALLAASKRGYARVVKCLLDHGADVNALSIGSDYGTALLAATAGGYTRVVECLIDHGADVNQQVLVDTKTLISLLEAWQRGEKREDTNLETREELVTTVETHRKADRQPETAVEVARWMGSEDIAQLLISRGAQDLQPVWDKANSEVEEASGAKGDEEQAKAADNESMQDPCPEQHPSTSPDRTTLEQHEHGHDDQRG